MKFTEYYKNLSIIQNTVKKMKTELEESMMLLLKGMTSAFSFNEEGLQFFCK